MKLEFIRISGPMLRISVGLLAINLLTGFHGCFDSGHGEDGGGILKNTLFVAHNGGNLVSYDIASGKAHPGEIPNLKSPTDMQALKDGSILVNLSETNEILILDGKTMLEKTRLPSSGIGAVKPVHSYLTSEHNGKQYWVSLNDGLGTAATNSARFIQIKEGHADYLKPVGEVGLGVGHHKAAWSATRERAAISNISDSNDIVTVLDYSDMASIKRVATLDWKAAGLAFGQPATPHGCAFAKSNGKAYCNLTGPGSMLAVDIDAAAPTFKLIKTSGTGGGYTVVHPGGRYVYSLQNKPREADTVKAGAVCQIGQIVVVDASTDSLVKELPLLYKGGTCTESIASGEAKAASPSHMLFSHDGKKAFIVIGGGAGASRMEGVLDASDPANPTQSASIEIGASPSRGQTMDADGHSVFVLNAADATVSEIDVAGLKVKSTITVGSAPKTLATFGDVEGPGYQTGPVH